MDSHLLQLRKAVYSDKDLIFAWVNDPEVRKQSLRSDTIEYENHLNWFKAFLENPNKFMYIGYLDTHPVCAIRFHIEDSIAYLSISVDTYYRGNGIATVAFSSIEPIILSHPQVVTIIGYVKSNNIGSAKALIKNGFVISKLKSTDYILCFEKIVK